MLHLAAPHGDTIADGGEGADVRVLDHRPLADDGGAADRALEDARPLFHDDLAQDLRVRDRAVAVGKQGVENDAVRLQEILEPSRVFPPPLDHVRAHDLARVDEPLDRIRDLELPPRRGCDGLDGPEDGGVEHVDAHQRQVRRRRLGLLDESHHLAVAQLGDPELARVGHPRQQDLAIGLLLAEALHQGGELFPDQVVPQVHAEGVRSDEGLRDEDGVGETERGLLLDVGHRDPEATAVPDGLADLPARIAHHDADLPDPGGRQRLDPVEKDGLVGHGNQLLGRGEGDGPEPGSAPTRED